MKSFSLTRVLFATLLMIKLALPFVANANQRTIAVLYKDQFVPSIDLPALEVSAPRTSALCEMKSYKNTLIPFVQLSEVTILSSATKVEQTQVMVSGSNSGVLAKTTVWKGQRIPSVELNSVCIQPDSAPETTQAEVNSSETPAIFKNTVRKTFDRLGSFFLEKGRSVVYDFFAQF
jgi:hypothetical protein